MEFIPRDGSPLKFPGDASVKLVPDALMCPITLARHQWQIEELDFAKRVCVGTDPVTLIDVGANMGLFSRQLLVAIPAITNVFAYEPEPRNFECLVHNLASFDGEVNAIQAAISNISGAVDFYLDPRNCGNYSLAINAMPMNYKKMSVEAKDVAIECVAWMKGDMRIFYKSDTEGLDELVAASIRPELWPRVFAGMIEIWNIQKPPFDRAAFASVLDQFPHKAFLANGDTRVSEIQVSTADVLAYIGSGNRLHRDLAFWR
jgi:FkbM family methyltransferase